MIITALTAPIDGVCKSAVQVIAGDRHPHHDGEMQPSELPYLPLDSDTPPNPCNSYALSKRLGEMMLEYFTRNFEIDTIAVRFPWLAGRRWMHHIRHANSYYDEGFSYLSCEDAAELIAAMLRAKLPGHRIYFPAACTPSSELPIPTIIDRFFKGVPLRKPVEQLTSLVDISRIEKETGWSPKDNLTNAAAA